MVSVAGKIGDLDLGIGNGGADQRGDIVSGHRHRAAYSGCINWRRASIALSASARRTVASSVSTRAAVRSPSSLRTTSSSPASSKSAWTTDFA
ncbi:hypothetical protein WR25_13936 [Diploscapter pachys]|uniref:Uncharacterized protein n=1 Tax=Diploscapter pachys TaxID=2018661 RepID=A0A2A2K0E8_9BILA|nr:hypothetical protein WR25_13936 [Diploscapter pachys]